MKFLCRIDEYEDGWTEVEAFSSDYAAEKHAEESNDMSAGELVRADGRLPVIVAVVRVGSLNVQAYDVFAESVVKYNAYTQSKP